MRENSRKKAKNALKGGEKLNVEALIGNEARCSVGRNCYAEEYK
jgi:hypothetical protein